MGSWLTTLQVHATLRCDCGEQVRASITIGLPFACRCGRVYQISGTLNVGMRQPETKPAQPAAVAPGGQLALPLDGSTYTSSESE